MKTALITGGSRGIGAATVAAFRQAGYAVTFFYRENEAAARQVAAKTGATPLCCDVSDPEAVKAACARVFRLYPHLDALVNNAGVAQQKLLTDVTDEDWRRMTDTCLSGAFYLCRAALPAMISRRQGAIVNVSSVWGRVGASCEAPYSAVKAGLIGLSKALAKEVGPSGVRVNAVCPGVIQTDMLSSFSQTDLTALAEATPLGRLGAPQDVARAILWLCEDSADFVTGQVLGVDGGFM